MASRSARPPRNRRLTEDLDEDGGLAGFLAEHRVVVGGLTAFVVAFSYVAANALWYQPHAHGSAFFATRPLAASQGMAPNGQNETAGQEVETVIRLEREAVSEPQSPAVRESASPLPMPRHPPAPQAAPQPPVVSGDPVVANVQKILADLNLYSGEVDGLTGPQTRTAIENYRKMVGLSASAEIDDPLLTQLGAVPRAQSGASPLPQGSPGTDLIETSSAAPRGDAMVMRIQAGLKAFGNDGIEIDGVVGPRTKSAILEFQSLFGLPETGEPDRTLLNKMHDIGLAD